MTTQCGSCGAELPAGAGRCPQCLALVKPPGFIRRLLDQLGLQFQVRLSSGSPAGTEGAAADRSLVRAEVTTQRTEQIEIRDATTGEVKVYRSLGDVPAQYRDKIAALRAAHPARATTSPTITFRDASGTEHTYQSLDEVPPHLRAVIERAQRGDR